MKKKKPENMTYHELAAWPKANLPDYEKHKIYLQKEIEKYTLLGVHIDAPPVARVDPLVVASIDNMKASIVAFDKAMIPLKAMAPLNCDFITEWETAACEADEFINFINNTHVPFPDISKLPPVKMMTVLAIMSKVEAEPKGIKEKISTMLKGLDNGRRDGVAKRQHTAKQKTNVIEQAIDDLFKNGKGFKMTIEEVTDFLLERRISTYERSTTLAKVKKLAPKIREKYKSGL
jgi:hypothetical protein